MKIPAILILLLLAASVSFAQNNQENILEDTNLQLFLEGEPSAQAVGFDNPKSFWQVSYELYLTDYSELLKLGICKTDNSRVLPCDPAEDKKSKKQIRKVSTQIAKGSFLNKNLGEEANREAKVKIKLAPEIVEVFNRSAADEGKNPTFILFITGRVSVENSDKQKFDDRYVLTSIKKLKTGSRRKDFEYWDVRRMYLTTRIIKLEDGRLTLLRGLLG